MSLRPFARWLFMRCFDQELRRIAREVRASDRASVEGTARTIGILDTLETLDLMAR